MDKTQAESRAGSNISPAAHDRCSDDEGSESGDLSGTSSEKQRPLDTRAQLREATQEEASKALHDFSWIDLTEPDPKYNGAAMHNKRLAPIWKDKQGNEMTGLFGRGCLKKDQAKRTAHGHKGHLLPLPLQDQTPLCGRAQTAG